MSLRLEDFADPASITAPQATAPPAQPDADRFDEGYNAGWEDALAQIEEEQGRLGGQLAERLIALNRDQALARSALISALEPMLRDVFDRVLHRAAELSFLPVLIDEIADTLAQTTEQLTLFVSPEDVAPLGRLLERAGIGPGQARIKAEPALALSQALIRWTGQERRVDLGHVLGGLDAALDGFFETIEREEIPQEQKEIQNG